MTRDEVMALTDEELQEEAERIIGWKRPVKRAYMWQLHGKRVNTEPGDYPHDIAAAWELVKQLERDGFKISVHTGMINPMTGDVLDASSAAIWNHDDIYWVGTAGPGESSLAITRAFVLAKSGGSDAR